MRNGATRMPFLTQLPIDLISMLQALILLFVAADAIIRTFIEFAYKVTRRAERGLGVRDIMDGNALVSSF